MGVEKQLLKAGNGAKPAAGQSVTVHCTGFGKNGDLSKKFWSTKDPGQKPFTFKIGQGSVIKGWDEGVMDMQVGEVARLQGFLESNVSGQEDEPHLVFSIVKNALLTMPMVPMDFKHGEYNPTQL